jgi:sarcosine oxidase delta subunit
MENTFSTFENQENKEEPQQSTGFLNEAPSPETPVEGNEFAAGSILSVPNLEETSTMVSSGFTDSNTIVGKISFIMLIFFLFVVCMKFGVDFITGLSNPSKIVLIKGMVDGQTYINLPQDPAFSNGLTIQRSVNESEGIEFTYSVWIFLESNSSNAPATTVSSYQHIFSKGSQNTFVVDKNTITQEINSLLNADGSPNNLTIPSPNYVINGPGVYLFNTNNIIIIMNTFNFIYDNVQVRDLPMNKWFNLIIRCTGGTMDAFINGSIIQSTTLKGIPMQNYGDVNIGMNGGFNGYLSNLTYYNYALGTKAITDIVIFGPNTSASEHSLIKDTYNQLLNTNYLSANWYFSEMGSNYI